MKKSYALIFLVLLFATTLSVAQITVKFQKPASWTAVNIYAYANDAPIIGVWPGPSLTETDGWYSYTFDATVVNATLIFNNAGAGEQTTDYYTTANVCLKSAGVLNAGGKYDVSAVPCTAVGFTVKFQKPESWTAVSLYTYGPEVTGVWPGTPITETDGWYTYTFDEAYTGGNLIFNNAGAGEQTTDFVCSGDVCLMPTGEIESGTGHYVIAPTPCATGGIQVTFQKPEAWPLVYLYAYVNGNPIIGGWPGALLTVDSQGLYTYIFDASVTNVNVIYNTNGALPQSADVNITASSCFTSDGTSLTVVDCSTITAISAVREKPFTIYPNPVTDKLNFNNYSSIDRVVISSLTGKNVLTETKLSKTGVLDVKSLKPGVYFVSIYFANGKQQFEKIVKR